MRRLRGTGRLYKRGRVWYASLPGKPAWSTSKTARDEAQAVLQEKLREHAKGIEYDPAAARKLKISDLVGSLLKEYGAKMLRSKKDAQSRWEHHLKPFFGEMLASVLGTDAMRQYRADRRLQGASDVTVNRELQVLRRAYKIAAESDPPKVGRVPKFKLEPEDNARKVFVDLPTLERLKIAATAEGLWARTFLEMAFSFGWRKSELLGLTVASIDFLRGVVMLADSKNGDPREAPITAELRTLLQALVAGKEPSDWLFPVKDIRYAWRRICERAGVKAGRDGIILHDAWRSSARNKRDAGVSESVVMSLQGWKTSAMFRRYAIVDNSDRLKALETEQRYAADQLQNRLQPPTGLPN